MKLMLVAAALAAPLFAQIPKAMDGGYFLPNGWRLTPVGRHVTADDYVLNLLPTPDGKNIVAMHCGYNPHGLVVVDPAQMEIRQRVPLKSAWFGLAWSPDGKKLYASGGNGQSRSDPTAAPVYEIPFADGRLAQAPSREFRAKLPAGAIYWSALAHHPTKPLLYAANRGTQAGPGRIYVFETTTGTVAGEIATEIHPYDLVLDSTGDTLYVSNWGSRSVSVIDTQTMMQRAVVQVGNNPNDMVLGRDGRLFVACSNENSVYVIDTKTLRAIETISTAMYKRAPVGSTPNALALDPTGKMLFVANADNNNVAVVNAGEREVSDVLGFIPTSWYPSALAVSADARAG